MFLTINSGFICPVNKCLVFINDNCACMFLFELKQNEISENPKTNQSVSLSKNFSSYISFVQ